MSKERFHHTDMTDKQRKKLTKDLLIAVVLFVAAIVPVCLYMQNSVRDAQTT